MSVCTSPLLRAILHGKQYKLYLSATSLVPSLLTALRSCAHPLLSTLDASSAPLRARPLRAADTASLPPVHFLPSNLCIPAPVRRSRPVRHPISHAIHLFRHVATTAACDCEKTRNTALVSLSADHVSDNGLHADVEAGGAVEGTKRAGKIGHARNIAQDEDMVRQEGVHQDGGRDNDRENRDRDGKENNEEEGKESEDGEPQGQERDQKQEQELEQDTSDDAAASGLTTPGSAQSKQLVVKRKWTNPWVSPTNPHGFTPRVFARLQQMPYVARQKKIRKLLRARERDAERTSDPEVHKRRLEWQRVYYVENKDKVREWYEENRDHVIEYKKTWDEKNKEHVREYYEKQPEETKMQMKEYLKTYRIEKREQIAEKAREWREKNKDKLREYARARYARKKAEREAAKGGAIPIPAHGSAAIDVAGDDGDGQSMGGDRPTRT